MTDAPSVQVFIADAFKREARHLRKRDRSIESDLQPLVEQLQNRNLPGDRISGFADYIVSKSALKTATFAKTKVVAIESSTKA